MLTKALLKQQELREAVLDVFNSDNWNGIISANPVTPSYFCIVSRLQQLGS